MNSGTGRLVDLRPVGSFRTDFSLDREMPRELEVLDRISMNYAWSWLPGGVELFRDLGPRLWDECEQNPRLLLKRIDDLTLTQWAADAEYTARVAAFGSDLSRYLSPNGELGVENGELNQGTNSQFSTLNSQLQIAYFCAEYGVHNSLPNYSGGLGILAGDHLKSASDLNVPLVAVGLLYRFGYFRQRIGHEGWQEEVYADIFQSELAITPVTDANGERIKILIHIRGNEVQCQAWLALVGRIRLYLLDTNLPENSEVDRFITGHLYGGDSETRIVQEKVLGIGGVRLLRKLGITPSVYHLNEGHSAFLTIELAHEYMQENPDATFADAADFVRRRCVFTTHTPVAAGNDAFNPETIAECFSSDYVDSLKISRDAFYDLGRTDPNDDFEFFGMTPLALRMCRSANGVSEKHGEVSRDLWRKLYIPDNFSILGGNVKLRFEINPITYVTNGVHPRTWIAPLYQKLFEHHIGADWNSLTADREAWAKAVNAIPDADIWSVHQTLKQLLVAFVRKRLKVTDPGVRDTINEHSDTRDLLSADALTIGFARRVAAYKRWDLILSDLDRLLRLVDSSERPVQFIFAGKAHPQDQTAKKILQQLMSINHDSGWQHRAAYIADYDQEVARYLVHGVDVWMNVPRRPLEASGTSGMKAAMNGVLNFSILDGWWMEGYNGDNGFAIGNEAEARALSRAETGDTSETDAADGEAMYSTLEQTIVPSFYSLGEGGLPSTWIKMMKASIATLTPQFSSNRMVGEYLEKIYRAN